MKSIAVILVASVSGKFEDDLKKAATDIKIECPLLTCEERLERGVCYRHDGFSAALKIRGGKCEDLEGGRPMFCPFNPNNDEFMWIDEFYQG
jgi:hypothetical protein